MKKECTYYHELDYTEWCQFSKNEPTCTLDDVFVQLGFYRLHCNFIIVAFLHQKTSYWELFEF